jgi:glycosyltransferase involved in cell wall biosynthesis
MIVKHKDVVDDTVVQLFRNNLDNPKNKSISRLNLLIHAFKTVEFLIREYIQRYQTNKWKPKSLFNFNIAHVSLKRMRSLLFEVDVICLHSIQSFLSASQIKEIQDLSQAPIVWTLMDVEPFTGGCHFNNGCDKYQDHCGNCPELETNQSIDISEQLLKKKRSELGSLPITFVAPTSNAFNMVRSSSLFNENRIEKILLSTEDIFLSPIDRDIARTALNLPKGKKIIFFGAFNLMDKRKGGDLLLQALRMLKEKSEQSGSRLLDSVALVTIGNKDKFDIAELPIEWIHLGMVTDSRLLRLIYYSADLYACPSIDDMGPLMINESYSCGLPIVSFQSGVGPDLIKNSVNGYLIEDYDVKLFSEGIYSIIKSDSLKSRTSSRDDAPINCSMAYQAQSYLTLFNELTAS